jgi:excisionase family DNA binding protein
MNDHERALEALPENPTIRQVADFAQTHEQTVRRWIKTGQLRAFHVGTRAVRVDRASVAAMFHEIAAP